VDLALIGRTLVFTVLTTAVACAFALLVGTLYASFVRSPWSHLSFWRAISSIPPVLVGLLVYLLFSRQGPLGFLRWLFTPKALVVAQFLLAMPMAISLCLQQRVNLPRDMEEFILVNLPSRRVKAMMLHLRGSLVNIGFLTWGRILGEVGAATLSGGAIVVIPPPWQQRSCTEQTWGSLLMLLPWNSATAYKLSSFHGFGVTSRAQR